MDVSIDLLAALSPAQIRSALAGWVAGHLDADADTRADLARRLQALVDAAGDPGVASLRDTFARAGDAWRFHPADPLARDITRVFMQAAVPTSELVGTEHLDAFLAGPPARRLVVCNHLSYTDTQVTDVALARAGRRDVADRLVAVAGPKVYTEPWRRMASIALNTRKTAQSSAVASEQDTLSSRELIAIAFEAIADCARLMDEGYVVLLYPEGTRSRDGHLQPFLRAAARYLTIEGVRVLPLAQVGGETIFPFEAHALRPGHARLTFGEAFSAADHPGKTGALDEAHRRLAALLPATHRPHPAPAG